MNRNDYQYSACRRLKNTLFMSWVIPYPYTPNSWAVLEMEICLSDQLSPSEKDIDRFSCKTPQYFNFRCFGLSLLRFGNLVRDTNSKSKQIGYSCHELEPRHYCHGGF